MDILSSLSQYGIAGIILYLVAQPLINYLITANREKDDYLKKLVNEHFKHDEERHQVMMRALKELPAAVLKTVADALPKMKPRARARR